MPQIDALGTIIGCESVSTTVGSCPRSDRMRCFRLPRVGTASENLDIMVALNQISICILNDSSHASVTDIARIRQHSWKLLPSFMKR